MGPVDMLVSGLNRKGHPVCSPRVRRIFRVPGFDGRKQKPLDWVTAVRRNLGYLLAPARDRVEAYERGLPRSCWSSYENSVTGQRKSLAYPALHHASFIFAFLKFSKLFPSDPMAVEAQRQARVYGEWLLRNRFPAKWACGLFPYSTIENGRLTGGMEGGNITLFRAARVGEAMLALHRAFGGSAWLDYAKHLAVAFVQMQRSDGSWPYRVNPRTGAVTEDYTSNVVTPARFLGMIEAIQPDKRCRRARRTAIQWMMKHPVKTRRWQGMYEDVDERPPYSNLQHWDTNEAIRYLVHFRTENPSFMKVAKELNGWIEDQFIVWQDETSSVLCRCPTPTALEQYHCYAPMEVHTANWLLSLLALHGATEEEIYLRKAVAAANSIVRGQQPGGAFSTWGNDRRFSHPPEQQDWPGCNACAVSGLLRLHEVVSARECGGHVGVGLEGI